MRSTIFSTSACCRPTRSRSTLHSTSYSKRCCPHVVRNLLLMIADLLNVHSACALVTGIVSRMRYSFLSSFILDGHASARCCNVTASSVLEYDGQHQTEQLRPQHPRRLDIKFRSRLAAHQSLYSHSYTICQIILQFIHLASTLASSQNLALSSDSAVLTTSIISRFTSSLAESMVSFCPLSNLRDIL